MIDDPEKNIYVRLRHTNNAGTSKTDCDSFIKDTVVDKLRNPDRPWHRHRVSLFSASNSSTNPQGILTGFILLMIITNTCHILESITKHGSLVNPHVWIGVFLHKPTESPILLIFLSFVFVPLLSLTIETLLSKGKVSNKVGSILIILLLAALLSGSAVVVMFTACYTVTAVLALISASAVFLKLVSYHLVNYWCRCYWSLQNHHSSAKETTKAKKETYQVFYPDNVNIKDIYYFFLAPTLSYELNFPRTPYIRKTFLTKRVLEMVLLLPIICCLTQQCVAPIMKSLLPYEESWINCSRMLNVLKLLTSGFTVWFLSFYFIFHSCMNASAEILRFGDRYFYGDWWNVGSMGSYHRRWNVPVHHWCAKHIYTPLIDRGMSRLAAATIVFAVSGFFHEYFSSIPLRIFRVRNLVGMTGQGPFTMLMDRLIPKIYFNILIWIILFAQSLAILVLYNDYVLKNQRN